MATVANRIGERDRNVVGADHESVEKARIDDENCENRLRVTTREFKTTDLNNKFGQGASKGAGFEAALVAVSASPMWIIPGK